MPSSLRYLWAFAGGSLGLSCLLVGCGKSEQLISSEVTQSIKITRVLEKPAHAVWMSLNPILQERGLSISINEVSSSAEDGKIRTTISGSDLQLKEGAGLENSARIDTVRALIARNASWTLEIRLKTVDPSTTEVSIGTIEASADSEDFKEVQEQGFDFIVQILGDLDTTMDKDSKVRVE